jgi:hypothetical protein
MNRFRMFFVQTSALPPCMHQKLTKHGRFCKQNNQLPTKSHVQLNDNSNVITHCSSPIRYPKPIVAFHTSLDAVHGTMYHMGIILFQFRDSMFKGALRLYIVHFLTSNYKLSHSFTFIYMATTLFGKRPSCS